MRVAIDSIGARILTVGAFVLMALGAASPSAQAQAVTAGQTELLGYGGFVTDSGGLTFGGGIQHAVRSRIVAAVEVGYLTIEGDSTSGLSIDGNAHYLFPQATSNGKLVPYLLGGIGFQRVSVTVAGFSASDSTVGVNVGGGARWQGGANWGLRPELKVLIAEGTNARFTLGFYRTF